MIIKNGLCQCRYDNKTWFPLAILLAIFLANVIE